MLKPRKGLILFAKAPEPRCVKTRLVPQLSAEQASGLYQAFVMDLVSATGRLKGITRIMACDPARHHPFFDSIAHRFGMKLIDQQGANLGERMKNAIKAAHRLKLGPVVIIGTDSPTLPMEFVRQAFGVLHSRELVLGPSCDGGYYLIGCAKGIPPVFEGIPWGTDQVLTVTLERITRLKLKCALLPFWYDVDRVEDLRLLTAHLDYLDQPLTGSSCPSRGGGVAPKTARVVKAFKLE